MTHYDIHYEPGYSQAKHDKAIQDIKDYLGVVKYEAKTAEIGKLERPPLNVWTDIYAPFSGVRGYPAHAWYYEIWPDACEAV